MRGLALSCNHPVVEGERLPNEVCRTSRDRSSTYLRCPVGAATIGGVKTQQAVSLVYRGPPNGAVEAKRLDLGHLASTGGHCGWLPSASSGPTRAVIAIRPGRAARTSVQPAGARAPHAAPASTRQ